MPGELVAFLDGKVIPVKEVGDGVFSEGIMGDGIAIIPENETLVSPVAGEIAVTMDASRHACAVRTDNGMEILLHIGLDTVDMNGDGFEYLITKGQRVKAGTPLIRFSKEKIRAAGHRDVTMCIISDPGQTKNLRYHLTENAKAGETVVATFE
ncbi:PTS glucose transporter subunit IIA [Eubacterium sp. An3]|uniref:PTS sugar transporter subunit IIA n=1 Tax=Eubacterium sp. An3 TaxID=1965628 RepID=UPI0031B81B82